MSEQRFADAMNDTGIGILIANGDCVGCGQRANLVCACLCATCGEPLHAHDPRPLAHERISEGTEVHALACLRNPVLFTSTPAAVAPAGMGQRPRMEPAAPAEREGLAATAAGAQTRSIPR